MNKCLLTALGLVLLHSYTLISADDTRIDIVKGVLQRTAGKNADSVVVTLTPDNMNNPSYKYHAKNGKLFINATTPVAACRGFYDYLRANNLGMIGWRGPVLRMPEKWPDTPERTVTSPFKFNQMYNVVTAGYSFPYWNWTRWEHEFDWLALHGYNMILDPIAFEAISERVWKKIGLTQQEIDDFTCGPAHAPWHRMGNIAKVDGPLPAEWHKDQIALQHKMLKRMKGLGITPVFQCFAGFVPHGMKRLFPEEKYYITHWNSGLKNERAPIYLMPDSPLFKKIMKLFISEWEKEFGKGKYYLIDTFNELKNLPAAPGQSLKDIMLEYGKNLSEILSSCNPDAVWALQGWIFHYQRKMWKPEIVKALLSNVPDNKMLIFDMMGVWRNFDGFYGKPWIYGMITNMGGKNLYTGDFNIYIKGPETVIKSPDKGNNVGNSNHSEGIETNEIIFELIADTGWLTNIKFDKWLKMYCMNRYGAYPEKMKNAWNIITNCQYKRQKWNSRFSWLNGRPGNKKKVSSSFIKGIKEFLSLHNEFKNSPFYTDDAVEMASFVLGQKAEEFFNAASNNLNVKNMKAYSENLQKGQEFLIQADRLLESHSLNRLERWIGFARQHSANGQLKNYYEENAKRILTSWGPPVNDYSARIWSGLIRDFYLPRITESLKAKAEGKNFDKYKFEEKWLQTPGLSKATPYPDPTAAAYQLVCDAAEADPTKH